MKRLTTLLALVLAMLLLFNSCALFEKPETPSNDKPAETEQDPKPDPTPDPEPDPTLAELYPEALTFADLVTSKNAMRYADLWDYYPSGDQPIKALVTFVQFTDGHPVNKETFEDKFNGDYDYENCMRSLASYYKYASYGKVSFDFTFLYYESDMTCEQAWLYVNEEDENGHFYGNQFFYDIFNEMKAENKAGINYKDLDGNGDGYVDLSIFVFGDDSSKTVPGKQYYNVYGSAQGFASFSPDLESPTLHNYVKTDYENMLYELDDASYPFAGSPGTTLYHEVGHTFGLEDYYDGVATSTKTSIEALGGFDMMEDDCGDQNAFSKFALGFIEPYVVQDIEDEITIRMSVSEDHSDVILIPTSKGWNGTAFDEYILIDICAPIGANGFYWNNSAKVRKDAETKDGGVRIYHVDARLKHYEKDEETNQYGFVFIDPEDALRYEGANVLTAFINSRGVTPTIDGVVQSEYYHLVELVPSNKTSFYRAGNGDTTAQFCTWHLFTPGKTFTLDTSNNAFTNAPRMNNGGTLDYSVTVKAYDGETHEAVITIKNISNAH